MEVQEIMETAAGRKFTEQEWVDYQIESYKKLKSQDLKKYIPDMEKFCKNGIHHPERSEWYGWVTHSCKHCSINILEVA